VLNCIRQREVVDLSAKPFTLVRGRDRKLAERPGVRLAKKGNRRVEFWTPESHCSDKFSQKFGNESMACGKPFRCIFHGLVRCPVAQSALCMGSVRGSNELRESDKIVPGCYFAAGEWKAGSHCVNLHLVMVLQEI
jgi:hypothetical protein